MVVLSVTEGEDKPLKYPVMFNAADLVLVTKCDLVPHLDVDLAKLHDALARVMPSPRVIEVSARTGQGLDAWVGWLDELAGTARLALLTGRKHEHAHSHDHDEPGHGHGHSHDHAEPEHGHSHGHAHGRKHGHGR